MSNMHPFGERLAQSFKEQGISQEIAAEKIGTSQSSISRWMREGPPQKRMIIQQLGILLNKNPEWLRTGEGELELTPSERNLSLKEVGLAKIHGPIIDMCATLDLPTVERLKAVLAGKNQMTIAVGLLRALAEMGEISPFDDRKDFVILPDPQRACLDSLLRMLVDIAAASGLDRDRTVKIDGLLKSLPSLGLSDLTILRENGQKGP